MAASISLYGSFPGDLARGNVDWENDTIKVALLTSSYAPDQDTDSEFSDASGNEASGTGYTAGGATLSSKTMVYDASTNTRTFDAADVEWDNSSLTARYAVIYDDSATNKPLIAYVDFGAERTSSEGLFRIAWHADGIFEVTV